MELNETLVFGPNVPRIYVNVSILEDSAVEYDEMFTIKLSSSDGAVMVGMDTAEVTILEDNDSKLYTSRHTLI